MESVRDPGQEPRYSGHTSLLLLSKKSIQVRLRCVRDDAPHRHNISHVWDSHMYKDKDDDYHMKPAFYDPPV